MRRCGSAWVSGVALLVAACPRPVGMPSPEDSSGVDVQVVDVDLETDRPVWSGAGVFGEPGERVVRAYTGDVVWVAGTGWEGLRAELAVGSVVLKTAAESGDGVLGGEVPDDLPLGELQVLVAGEQFPTGALVSWMGPGRLQYLAPVGLVSLQVAVTAGGAAAGSLGTAVMGAPQETKGGSVAGGPMSGWCDPSQALGLAFNLGTSPDPTQAQYLAAVSGVCSTSLGTVAEWPAGGPALRGRRVESLRAYVDGDGVVRVAGLEHGFAEADGGVANLFRLVTTAGGTVPDPDLRGPVFHRGGSTPALLALRELPTDEQGPAFRVVSFPLGADGRPGAETPVGEVLRESPVAAGLVSNSALSMSALGLGSDLLVLASCTPQRELVLRMLPLREDGSVGENLVPALHRTEDSCSSALCSGAQSGGRAESTDVQTAPGLPSVPAVLREIVSDLDHTLVVLPSATESWAGTEATSCAIVLPGYLSASDVALAYGEMLDGGAPAESPRDANVTVEPPDGSVMVEPLDGSVTVELPDAGAKGPARPDAGEFPDAALEEDAGPDCSLVSCYSQHALMRTTRAAALVRTASTELVGLGSGDDPTMPTRELWVFRHVVDGMDMMPDRLTTDDYHTAVFGDGSGMAYALRDTGDVVDVLGAGGQARGTLSALGRPLAAWPLDDVGKVAMVRRNAVFVTDTGGFPDRFRAVPAFLGDTVALERNAAGDVVALWGSRREAGGVPCLYRWSAGPDGVNMDSQAVKCLGAGDSLVPVLVDSAWVVVSVQQTQAPADGPCAGLGPDGQVLPTLRGTEWLAVLPQGQSTQLRAVPDSCNAVPKALNAVQHRLFASARREDWSMLLRAWDLGPAGTTLVLEEEPAQALLPLPSGGTLGTMVDELFGTRRLGCIAADGSVVHLGTAPFAQGAMTLSPDGTALYVGTAGSILALDLPPLLDTGCPAPVTAGQASPLRVTGRASIPGTPSQVELDRTGARLLWVDADAELVGAVE